MQSLCPNDVGFKLADVTFWSFLNNAKGHDIIRAHLLVNGKKATVTGWIYPNAHYIEIDSIKVDGVSSVNIAKAAWNEDQEVAKALMSRKMGQAQSIKRRSTVTATAIDPLQTASAILL